MRAAAAVLPLAFLPSLASASMWVDPDWPTMLRESDLIVRAEVVEGGTFEATVKVLATFRGKAPAEPIRVGGYNNRHWPPDAVEAESLRTGETWFLFLEKVDRVDDRLADPSIAELARAGRLFTVWTPTAGDLPVRAGGVRYTLAQTGYAQHQGSRSVEEFERFLQAAVRAADGKPDARYVAERKAQLGKERTGGPVFLHALLEYELAGGTELLPSFVDAAKGDAPAAKFPLARLAGRAGGEKGKALLVTLLDDPDGAVQGEAVRQLAAGKFPASEVAPLLLSRLSSASSVGSGPGSLMDPVRNERAGGQVEIVRALGAMKHAPAEPALLELYPTAPDELTQPLLDALDALGSRGIETALEKRIARLERIAYGDATLERIGAKKLVALRPAVEAFLGRATSAYDRGDAAGVLARLGDPAAAPALERALAPFLGKKLGDLDTDEARTHLQALAALKASAAKGTAEALARHWLGVTADDDEISFGRRISQADALLASARAVVGAVDEARGRVFPDGEVRLEVLVPGKADPNALQQKLAKKLSLPVESIGVRVGSARVQATVGLDPRLDPRKLDDVLQGLCSYARAVPQAVPPSWPTILEYAARAKCDP